MSENNNKAEYVCPLCNSELVKTETAYTCSSCNSVWPIEHNIPRFARSEVQWSVFEPEVAKKLPSWPKMKVGKLRLTLIRKL